ncbi:MAG TPA: hypothetical protein VHU19_11815 [Pyrinomonadaceae bacterium]|nr:hypothetical protein [Pyrinomonadaceae bacterium]
MRRRLISAFLLALVAAGAFQVNSGVPLQKQLNTGGGEQSHMSALQRAESLGAARALAFRNRAARRRAVGEWPARKRGCPLWPGARFTDAERERSIERGMRFVYRTARSRVNFSDYGSDYVWWFGAVSHTVRDERLRRLARGMALECARRWRAAHHTLPPDADAETVAEFVSGGDAAESLGLGDERLKEQLRRAASRFSARDYLAFDPLTEPPPADVPDECEYDGASDNPRGARRCHVCKRPLTMRTRFDVWYDALITAHTGDHYGVRLGAHYADVLKWLPVLRPYSVSGRGTDAEFMDAVYSVTHVVYTLNDYWTYRLNPQLLPREYAFLRAGLPEAINVRDADMLGEIMDSLKSFGLDDSDPLIRKGTQFLLVHQNRDGSWGDVRDETYDRYHATETAVNGLCEYAARGEGLSFPELEPLLRRWAQE